MKLNELKAVLAENAGSFPRFVLPTGEMIPAHYHITEVGHVAKRFVDCGGKMHDTTETCLLQSHVAGDVEHRLTAERFGTIMNLAKTFLPSDDLGVEVEYDCCVVA